MRMHVYAQHDAPLYRWGIVAARASLSWCYRTRSTVGWGTFVTW